MNIDKVEELEYNKLLTFAMFKKWELMKRFLNIDNITVCCLFFSMTPLLIAVISVYFMPNTVPMHYNGQGEIDRWGRSSEMLFIGALFAIFPAIMSIAFHKIKMSSSLKVIGLVGAISMSIIFVILQIIFTVKIFNVVGEYSHAWNTEFCLSFGITVYGVFMVLASVLIAIVPTNKVFIRNLNREDLRNLIAKRVTLLTGGSGIIICLCSALIKNIYSLIPFAICIILTIAIIIVMCKPRKNIKISGGS